MKKFCKKCEIEYRTHKDDYQCPKCHSYETEDLEDEGQFVKRRNFDDEKDN